MINKIRSTLAFASLVATALLCVNISSAAGDDNTGGCADNPDAKLGFCVIADGDKAEARYWKTDENESEGNPAASDPSTLDDQRPKETAQAAVAPEVKMGWHWEACILTAIGKEANSRIASDYECDSPPPTNDKQEQQDPGR